MSDDSYETAGELIRQGAIGKVVMAHIDYLAEPTAMISGCASPTRTRSPE